jgi:hypothetical protein
MLRQFKPEILHALPETDLIFIAGHSAEGYLGRRTILACSKQADAECGEGQCRTSEASCRTIVETEHSARDWRHDIRNSTRDSRHTDRYTLLISFPGEVPRSI